MAGRAFCLSGLCLIVALCGGCDAGPDLPGPLPVTAPYPGPPPKPKVAWSELRVFDTNGEPISVIPMKTPYRVVLRLRLEEGSPKPKAVIIAVGVKHQEHGFMFYDNAGGLPNADATGEIRIEREFEGISRSGQVFVCGQFDLNPFVEVPLEVLEPAGPS